MYGKCPVYLKKMMRLDKSAVCCCNGSKIKKPIPLCEVAVDFDMDSGGGDSGGDSRGGDV